MGGLFSPDSLIIGLSVSQNHRCKQTEEGEDLMNGFYDFNGKPLSLSQKNKIKINRRVTTN